MTEQEAKALVEWFKNRKGKTLKLNDKGIDCVIEALDKQISQTPTLWGDGYSDGELVYDMYDCPNCGKHYELDYEQYDYCPNCGQKLDWTVLEGEDVNE